MVSIQTDVACKELSMTTVHVELIGNKAMLSRGDLEQLMELARRTEAVEIETNEEDIPTVGIVRLAEPGGAFDWLADEEDIYSIEDLRVRYQ